MREITLQAVPNQRVTVTLADAAWDIELKACQQHMAATIMRDGVTLISGQRIVAGRPLIPYRYLAAHGNFVIPVALDQEIDWREFGNGQNLFFIEPDELP